MLRAIAGFVRPAFGRVVIGGEVVNLVPPERRTVGIVFQNYALFPHMSVADNVAYGLEARGVARDARRARVEEMLAMVQLGHLAERLPRQLSGGQQQRVALARALAVKPSILLLDEPFAALDKNLRLDMQIEVKRIQRLAGTTTVLVTHDQEEALSMADRVAVLNAGRLEQYARPTEIYDRPGTLFVNTFVGTANLLRGRLSDGAGPPCLLLDGGGELSMPEARTRLPGGTRVVACIRPEHLRLSDGGQDSQGEGLAGVVSLGLPLGATIVHEVRLPGGAGLKVAEPRALGGEPRAPGTPVRVRPASPDSISIFPET